MPAAISSWVRVRSSAPFCWHVSKRIYGPGTVHALLFHLLLLLTVRVDLCDRHPIFGFASSDCMCGCLVCTKRRTLAVKGKTTTWYYNEVPDADGGDHLRTLGETTASARQAHTLKQAVVRGDRGAKAKYDQFKSNNGIAGYSPLLYVTASVQNNGVCC